MSGVENLRSQHTHLSHLQKKFPGRRAMQWLLLLLQVMWQLLRKWQEAAVRSEVARVIGVLVIRALGGPVGGLDVTG